MVFPARCAVNINAYTWEFHENFGISVWEVVLASMIRILSKTNSKLLVDLALFTDGDGEVFFNRYRGLQIC